MLAAVEPRKRRWGKTLKGLEPTRSPSCHSSFRTRLLDRRTVDYGRVHRKLSGPPILEVSKASWARTSARGNGVLIAAKRTERRVRRPCFPTITEAWLRLLGAYRNTRAA